MALATASRNRRIRLLYILILVNLIIILFPLAGLAWFRIYDNQLVRSTESELIAQAVVIREAYADAFRRHLGQSKLEKHSRKMGDVLRSLHRQAKNDNYEPIYPTLNLRRDHIFAASGEGETTTISPSQVADQAGEELLPLLRKVQRATLAGIRIVDHQGIVVGTTRSQLHNLLSNRTEIDQALKGYETSILRERNSDFAPNGLDSPSRSTKIRVLVALPAIVDERIIGAIVASRTPANIAKNLYQQKLAVSVFLVTMLIVVVLVAGILSGTISRPLRSLVERARLFEKGGEFEAVDSGPFVIREVHQLNQAMRQMAQTLRSRARYLQSFMRSLSHEFKTPLTSIDGALEILAENDQSLDSGQKQKFHGMIRKESAYLNMLVNRLLSLARADLAEPKMSRVRLDKLLTEACDRFRDNLDISLEPEDPVAIDTDPEILSTVFNQILDNVMHHAGTGTKVQIEVSRTNNAVVIGFQDFGAGISTGNLQRVFEPFFTTASDSGGTGLGLSISRSLLNAIQGEISLVSNSQGGLATVSLQI